MQTAISKPPNTDARIGVALLTAVAFILLATSASTIEAGQCDEACQMLVLEQPPSPKVESELAAIATVGDSQGPIIVVGRTRAGIGGTPYLPLVMERMAPDEDWIIHDPPNFGVTWHTLTDVLYLPGEDNDFLILGNFHSDPSDTRTIAFVMRYYRAEQKWETHELIAPDSWSTSLRSALIDPHDPNRLILNGAKATVPGFCFDPRPILAEFDMATNTHSFLDMGDLRGTTHAVVVLEDGDLLATGIGGDGCFYTFVLQVLRVQSGNVIVAPSPPQLPGHPFSALTGLTMLPDGRVLGVGHAHETHGSNYLTLSYFFAPRTGQWELVKPLDPGQTLPNGEYANQFASITQAPDGTVYAGGRWTYHDGQGYKRKGMVQRFDGHSWCLHELPEFLDVNSFRNNQVLGLATTDTDIYAAGWWNQGGLPYEEQTLVLHAPLNAPLPDVLFRDGFEQQGP